MCQGIFYVLCLCCFHIHTGLMMSGFSQASFVLGDQAYLEQAKKVATFVKKHLYNSERGTLMRNAYRDRNG